MQGEARSLFDAAMTAKLTVDNAADEQKIKISKGLWWQCKIAIDTVKDHVTTSKLKQAIERTALGMDEPELSAHDIESMTDAEFDYMVKKNQIPMRFRKIA